MFRIKVRSSDGVAVSITAQIDDHPREPRPYQLPRLAEQLLIARDQIETVLDEWSNEDLRKHLESHTADELRAPSLRRRS
jgi:hypothetical protein